MRPEQWQIMYRVFVSGGSLATLSEKDNGLDGQWGRWQFRCPYTLQNITEIIQNLQFYDKI